jgi:adenylate cyclase
MTLLFCDVVYWSGVLREFGDERMLVVTRAYHALVRRDVERHNGRVFELIADNVVAGFDRPLDALRAARDLREALHSEPWAAGDDPPGVCMAIHSGRVTEPRSGYFGTTAFRCSILCNSAEPWQVLVSHATEALLEGAASDVSLRDLGERTLRGFDQPAHVFELV